MRFEFENNLLKVYVNNIPAGSLTFHKNNGIATIESIYVAHEFRGQGIAGKVLEHFVSYVRENGLKVLPRCSYAIAVFERDKNLYKDILA